MKSVLDTILLQVSAARRDLSQYHPPEMDWTTRVAAAARVLVPWLESTAPGLKSFVEDVLNAPLQLRRMWMRIRSQVALAREEVEAFDRQLSLDDVLRESVTGEVVSKIITQYLTERKADLKSNGRSDYPDLFLDSLDYSGLPAFRRNRAAGNQEYGAALKGSQKRPVRVPDGLEIKTCRDQIRVDCHHPHAGMHLVLVFSEIERLFTVIDVRIGFLKQSDYHEARRNTTATTPKYSFNGEQFVSLLAGESPIQTAHDSKR